MANCDTLRTPDLGTGGASILAEIFRVGELEIVRILELEFPLGPSILPIGQDHQALVAACPWAKPHFVSEAGDVIFALTAHGLVSQGQRILIDPCLSFDLRRDNPDIAERAALMLDQALPEAGFHPDRVDVVINSHIDGVGWNCRPGPDGWRPAFPNARHLFTEQEISRVCGGAGDEPVTEGDAESLRPLREAGLIEGVSPDARVGEHVRLAPSPGHTPGNVDIWVESEGASAVLVGDHVLSPLQCAEPAWAGLDLDAEASPKVRRALLEECALRETLLLGPHFGSPGAGRVRAEGSAWRVEPVAPDRVQGPEG